MACSALNHFDVYFMRGHFINVRCTNATEGEISLESSFVVSFLDECGICPSPNWSLVGKPYITMSISEWVLEQRSFTISYVNRAFVKISMYPIVEPLVVAYVLIMFYNLLLLVDTFKSTLFVFRAVLDVPTTLRLRQY
jgi:hypothetical protein